MKPARGEAGLRLQKSRGGGEDGSPESGAGAQARTTAARPGDEAAAASPPLAAADPAAWPASFRFFAGACGLKKNTVPDLLWAVADPPARAAAVFTANRLQAAPVRLSRRHLTATGGRVRALVVNSGNANCATGAAGERAARAVARAAARLLAARPEEIFLASTGVIGVPLASKKIIARLQAWRPRQQAAAGGDDGPAAAAQAILTTDTRAKLAWGRFTHQRRAYHVAGFAKGAGMIHPRMATMLAFLFTDAPLSAPALDRALRLAVAQSFHRITVDGDTSTNDTVALFAAGARRPALGRAGGAAFQRCLNETAASLARQIVLDGEGAHRFVTIRVAGARNAADADRAARAIAHSPLVKTAIAGADPNWGRILCAAGYSGARFDPEKAQIACNGMALYRRGRALPFDEAEAQRRLDAPEVEVRVHLGAGRAQSWLWTCDLTAEYIRINASYRT